MANKPAGSTSTAPFASTGKRSRPGDPANLTDEQRTMLEALLPQLERKLTLSTAAVLAKVNEAKVREVLDITGPVDYKTVIEAIVDRLAKHEAAIKALAEAHAVDRKTDRHDVAFHLSRINGRLDALGLDKQAILEALEQGSIGGRKSFLDALRASVHNDKVIREVLGMVPDATVDLTDEQFFTELFDRVSSNRRLINDHGRRLNDHDQILGPDGQHFNELRQQVTEVRVRNDDSLSVIWFIAAGVAGFFSWLFWLLHDFTQVVADSNKSGAITTTQTTTTGQGWDNPLCAIIVGLGVASAVILIGLLVTMRRNKVTTKTSTTRTTTPVVADTVVDAHTARPVPVPEHAPNA